MQCLNSQVFDAQNPDWHIDISSLSMWCDHYISPMRSVFFYAQFGHSPITSNFQELLGLGIQNESDGNMSLEEIILVDKWLFQVCTFFVKIR